MIGPDRHFIKYQADAHLESYEEFSVFSGKFAWRGPIHDISALFAEKLICILSATTSNVSTGLPFKVDFDFTFFLIKDEIGTSTQ